MWSAHMQGHTSATKISSTRLHACSYTHAGMPVTCMHGAEGSWGWGGAAISEIRVWLRPDYSSPASIIGGLQVPFRHTPLFPLDLFLGPPRCG